MISSYLTIVVLYNIDQFDVISLHVADPGTMTAKDVPDRFQVPKSSASRHPRHLKRQTLAASSN